MEDIPMAQFVNYAKRIVEATEDGPALGLAQEIYLMGRQVQYGKSNLAMVEAGREIERLKKEIADAQPG